MSQRQLQLQTTSAFRKSTGASTRVTAEASRPVLERLEVRQMLSGDTAAATPDFSQMTAVTVPNEHPNQVTEPVTVYTWSDWDIEGATPMVWAWAGSAQETFNVTIDQLRDTPEGQRGIFLFNYAQHIGTGSFADVIRNGGYDMSFELQWTTEYFTLLRDAGITPDDIILDHESGHGYWHIGGDAARDIALDPSLQQYLPDSITSLPAEAWTFGHAQWQDAVNAFTAYANSFRDGALNAAVMDTANAIFGEGISISNYNRYATSFEVFDRNNWTQSNNPTPTFGNASAPGLYLVSDGTRYRNSDDATWDKVLDNLNTVRSALNCHSDVTPWIAAPSTGESGPLELWQQQMRLLRATGVDTFLMWNPNSSWLTDDARADARIAIQNMIAELNGMDVEVHRQTFTAFDLGTNSLEIGGYGFDRSSNFSWDVDRSIGTYDPNGSNQSVTLSSRSSDGDININNGPFVAAGSDDLPVLLGNFNVQVVKPELLALTATSSTSESTRAGFERVKRLALIEQLDKEENITITIDNSSKDDLLDTDDDEENERRG